MTSDINERLYSLDPNKWYQVLIGFSIKPELRTGQCTIDCLRMDQPIKVLGEAGSISKRNWLGNYTPSKRFVFRSNRNLKPTSNQDA